jgi:hypothetical protein
VIDLPSPRSILRSVSVRSVVAMAFAILACFVAAACDQATPTGSSPAIGTATDPFDQAAAEAHCVDQGGLLTDRVATWNTNADPQARLELAGRLRLCEFESVQNGATTRISVDLRTLYAEEPTVAAVAYLSKIPPVLPEQPSANPASYNCSEGLGGTSMFGNTSTVGGWVAADEETFGTMNLCVFADMSAIDEFGIFYYATGAVRGADLAEKMRYDPAGRLPAMFAEEPG